MIGWIAIIIGLLALLAVCWVNKKQIKKWFKKNGKRVIAVGAAGTFVGAGASGLIIPEGYRPNTATMITNSNGRYWSATGANIQLAINDVNGTDRGTVWLPAGSDITISTTIGIWHNITLDCRGATISPDGDFDAFDMCWGSCIKNVIINLSSASYSNTTAAIHPRTYLGTGLESGNEGFNEDRILMGDNILVKGSGYTGIGLYVSPASDVQDWAYTIWNNIDFRDLNTSIFLNAPFGYINYHIFNNVNGQDCTYFIHFNETGATSEISMNMFVNVRYEAGSGNTDEHYPIYIQGNCDWNMFVNIGIMDWVAQGDTTDYIYIKDSTAARNWFAGSTLSKDYITDNGAINSFYGGGELDVDEVTAIYINRNEAADVGLKIFYNCADGSNAPFLIYGDDGGTDKFGGLQVVSTGSLKILSDTGENIWLAPSQGDNTQYVRIDDILKLDGRTTDPTSLADGMIWYNTTADLFYCRAGGATYTFNLTAV